MALVLYLCAVSTATAGDVDTRYFSLALPDSLVVRTDGTANIFAHGENGPGAPPLLVIEYSDSLDRFAGLRASAERSMQNAGGDAGLQSRTCGAACEAFYGEVVIRAAPEAFNQHFYLIRKTGYMAVVSYGERGDMADGRAFVIGLGEQIAAGR